MMIKKNHWACNGVLSVASVVLLMCMGCSEETVVQQGKGALTGGQVVVDYTVGEMSTRSVSHEALPAHDRIKSLTYLLYDNGGNLVKQREIPGIDKMQQSDWPMMRATMSWDQREALKDTLEQGQNYTAVFVANTDPTLFDGEEVLHLTQTAEGATTSVALDEVYLSLPTKTAFGDNNMFYLCVKQITPTGYDRDNHCDCPVKLQRIVSRTDFFSDDYPALDEEAAKGKVKEFTDKKVYDVLLPGNITEKMPLGIDKWLKSFTDDFALYVKAQGATLSIDDFTKALNGLDYSGYVNNISDTDKAAIKELLRNSCLENETLKRLWQPWTNLQAKVKYSSRADRFYVSGNTAKVGDATATECLSPMLDMTKLTETTTGGSTVTQNTFTIIGFGENAGAGTGDVAVLNKMKEVQLYESTSATTPVAVISMPDNVQSFADQGGNERVQLVYCPIKTLEYNTGVTTGKTYNLNPVSIKSGIENAMTNYSTYSQYLDNFFATDDCKKKYGESLEKFVLQITLPDLSQSGVLTVTPEWSVK